MKPEYDEGLWLGFHITHLEESSGFIFHVTINIGCGEECIEEGLKQFDNIYEVDRKLYAYIIQNEEYVRIAITSLDEFKNQIDVYTQKVFTLARKPHVFAVISGYDQNENFISKVFEIK